MATLPTPPAKRLKKSVLSLYLRTRCDRELYLSLHEDSVLAKATMPEPLKARPGIGVLSAAGREFEEIRNAQLLHAFPGVVDFAADKSGKIARSDLKGLLSKSSTRPRILLQCSFDPNAFRTLFLSNLGLAAPDHASIPHLSGLVPDVILVRDAIAADEELLPNGARQQINPVSEKRAALSVIDIKHTAEANPSYSAEVSLYALTLSSWLQWTGNDKSYFVTTRSYLWTRSHQGASNLDALVTKGGATLPQLVQALIDDCDDANLRFFIPSVLRFMREDLLRVISIGDTDWRKLDWHVDSRCTACDWLGLGKWATPGDKAKIAAHPDHYCLPNALANEHLSRIAGVSRGARKTLESSSLLNTLAVTKTTGSEPVYKQHTLLKRERSRLPARASALHSGTSSIDATVAIATLARSPHMHVNATVNFDASSGLLTGLALSGRATCFVKGEKALTLPARAYVVDQKTLAMEWVALEGFLSQLADYVTATDKFLKSKGVSKPLTGQVVFWERRQFEELCAAMGRHLPRVLALADRKARALAWLFPSEELMEKDEGAVSPCVAFAEEVIRRAVFSPTPHVITLLDTVEHYHFGTYAPSVPDSYYREFLADGIPRERIYEIWSGVATVQRGTVLIPRTTVMTEYSNALTAQCRALDSVVMRLRNDFATQLKATAPVLDLSIPRGPTAVAFDAKLWIWWDELEFATNQIAAQERLALDLNVLESNFQAIHLTNLLKPLANGNLLYSVSPESRETKLDDETSFLALGLASTPGFPLERVKARFPAGAPPYPGRGNVPFLFFHSAIRARLVAFNRTGLEAEIKLEDCDNGILLTYLATHAGLDFKKDIFLVEGRPFSNWRAKMSRSILAEVGNPPIAQPDPASATAMAMPPAAPGAAPILPVSRVLWEPDLLQGKAILPPATAKSIAAYATKVTGLNAFQASAVETAASKALTLIWGPPGTGKTKTLGGLVHGLVQHAASGGQGLKLLICGPTYKAVEEVFQRSLQSLETDPTCTCEMFMVFGRGRSVPTYSSPSKHLLVTSAILDSSDAAWTQCLTSLSDKSKITIVATVAHQARNIPVQIAGTPTAPVFDLVILDESSQIPVTLALAPLATLKSESRLVVAGDHLQMPPIASLEPPVGAEYLVGSIQTYLRSRSFKAPVVTCDLLENYRSSAEIVAFERTIGYPAGLKAHFPDTRLHLLSKLPSPVSGYPTHLPYFPELPTILDPSRGTLTILHDDEVSSQNNHFEARIVAGLVYCLRHSASAELDGRLPTTHRPPTPSEFWQMCVGIVTPHRAQRALVIQELAKLFMKDPIDLIASAVDTVERFQGGERHTIITSFGVGDVDVISGEEAFLLQLERTNVAISRAMAKCIVVMPRTLARHVPDDKRALQTAHALKGFVDDFCHTAKPTIFTEGSLARTGQVRFV